MEETPKTLDWVKARAKCSMEQMFMVLTAVVHSDVTSIQEHHTRATFQFSHADANKLVVSKSVDHEGGAVTEEAVVFECLSEGIRVRDGRTESVLFIAKPALTSTGECKFDIDGHADTLEPWQVSRKALERLFFG